MIAALHPSRFSLVQFFSVPPLPITAVGDFFVEALAQGASGLRLRPIIESRETPRGASPPQRCLDGGRSRGRLNVRVSAFTCVVAEISKYPNPAQTRRGFPLKSAALITLIDLPPFSLSPGDLRPLVFVLMPWRAQSCWDPCGWKRLPPPSTSSCGALHHPWATHFVTFFPSGGAPRWSCPNSCKTSGNDEEEVAPGPLGEAQAAGRSCFRSRPLAQGGARGPAVRRGAVATLLPSNWAQLRRRVRSVVLPQSG